MNDHEQLRGNIEAGLRLLLKSERPLYRQAAEVGITDLRKLVALLDERLSIESADRWLAHRFHEVCDERDRLKEERDAIGAVLGEPCAECGHIDWRSDGYAENQRGVTDA